MAYTYEDKLNFIKNLYCPARQVADETGCSWQLILAQAALETGWGEKVLPGTNNMFNIKADSSWHGESKVFHVWEEKADGSTVWVNDPFRVYPSILDSVRDRTKFLSENPRYAKAGFFAPGTKGDLVKEAEALHKGGYASDKKYAEKLKDLFEGRSMRRAIERAQKEGCKGCLPTLNVYILDAARVKMPGAKLKVSQNGKTLELVADKDAHVQIQAALSNGKLTIEVWSEHDQKWETADQDTKPSTPPTALTFIAPTIVVHSSTDEHQPPPAVSKAPAAATKPAAQPAPAPVPPGAPKQAAAVTYTVKKGDSLIKIAKAHGTTYLTIAKLNGISSPYYLRPGDVLRIPQPQHAGAAAGAHAGAGHAPAPAAAGSSHPAPASQPASHPAPGAAPGAGQPGVVAGASSPAANSPSAGHAAPASSPAAPPAPAGASAPAAGSAAGGAGQAAHAPESDVHAVRYRSDADHPQTDVVSAHRAPWMAVAEQEFRAGIHRGGGAVSNEHIREYASATSLGRSAGANYAYCAAFINWCLSRAGYRGNHNARAVNLATWGRETKGNKPAYGAVAVVRFPEGGYHVTFVAGMAPSAHGHPRIATLGGNQGGQHGVTHSAVPLQWVTHFRFPTEYVETDEDYNLQVVAVDNSQMTRAGTR